MNRLYEEFLKTLTMHYMVDPTSPGIMISYIKNNEVQEKWEYYVSIQRFLKPFGKERQVICKAVAPSLDEALRIAMKCWCVIVGKSINSELEAHMTAVSGD